MNEQPDALQEVLGPTRAEDPFYWHREALRCKTLQIPVDDWPPIDVNTPESGWYRMRRKGAAPWKPIAYWWEGKELKCLIGTAKQREWFHSDPDEHIRLAIEAWPYVRKNPISEETYDLVWDGGQWPDLDETVAAQVVADNERARIGGNNPPADEAAQYKTDVKDAIGVVETYAKIRDDETLARAQSARARLQELALRGEKKHRTLKAAILEQGRMVDRAWKHVADEARNAALIISAAMNAWLNEKDRIEKARLKAEEDKRLEEERKAEEERQRREAEERERAEEEQRAADAAIAQGVPPAQMEAPPPAPPPPPPAPPPPPPPVAPPTQIRGGYGRAAHVGYVDVAIITNQDELYAAVKEWPDVKAFFAGLAKKELQERGRLLPGCTKEQELKVK